MNSNIRRTHSAWTGLSLTLVLLILSAPLTAGEYYPPRGDWERRAPETMGFDAKPDYGYMWWLNPAKERIPAAPEDVFYAAGFGGNYIYVDQENDLLIVLRWVPDLAVVVDAVLVALL